MSEDEYKPPVVLTGRTVDLAEVDLLAAHGVLMAGLLEEPGKYRTRNAGVAGKEGVIHVALPPDRVPWLMKELFQWLETTELHPFLNPRPLERSEKIISAGNNDHRECFNPNSTRFKIQKQLHVTRLEILIFPVSVFA